MKEIVNLLEPREKKILAGLAVLLGALAVCLAIIAWATGGTSQRQDARVKALSRQVEAADRERTSLRAEVSRWEEARLDGRALRRDRFYREKNGVNELRLDLQKIFSGVGLEFPQSKFVYAELDKEQARKVEISFNFSGSYALLKRFLADVEKQPRILFVERVNFLKIDSSSGDLLLKVTLVAYYAI